MKNKYYIPNIEDLTIGYECEKQTVGEFSSHYSIFLRDGATKEDYRKAWDKYYCTEAKDFVKHIITFKDFEFLKISEDILGYVRTPYLTKEQIEDEGFELKHTSVDLWFKFKESPVTHTKIQDFYRYKPYNLFLNYGLHDCRLVIRCDFSADNDFDKADCLFEGECCSINELRFILKRLKIK